jgi:CheY-like chemotaxis protein
MKTRLHRILLVDDEPCAIQWYQAILHRGFNARIMTAQDGDQALQRISAVRPHLIISDLNHPGLNGLDLTRQVRRLYSRLPVVLISGMMSAEIRAEALGAGATACLSKPCSPAEFLHVLRRVWRHR